MTISCIAIDDEPLALEIVKHYASLIPELDLLDTFLNAAKAKDYIELSKPDLVFLDIQMPDVNGLEFLRSLSNPPIIVITTAFDKYAAVSFDMAVADYLMKPFEFIRFEKAVKKVRVMKSINTDSVELIPNSMYVKSNYELIKINFEDIEYLEGDADYIKIYLFNGSFVRTLITFKKIEKILPAAGFLRVHRGFIISTSKIKSISSKSIKLSFAEIPIGDAFKSSLDSFLKAGR